MSIEYINLDNLKDYNEQMQEAYIKPLADKIDGLNIDGLNIKNGEGEASIKSPDVENQSEDVEGFPEGRLNKVTGTQAIALGAAHKVTKRGGIALGAYGNIQTRFSAGIGYVNYTAMGTDENVEVGYGDGNIGIGDGNAITSKGGSVGIGTANKIGYIIRLTKEERDDIIANKRIPGSQEKVNGRTYGGYREDTIYLQQTHISESGRSSYKLLTEQRLQTGEYWTDPNTTVTYVDEQGKTKTYIAICKLSSKNSSGTGEFIGAVALGYGNRVTDTGATATGAATWADGFASFSAGEDTEAHGNRATVFGYDNLVYGNNAFVAGTHHDLKGSSVAGSNEDITIFGRWSQNKDNLLFAVGNGTEQYRLKSDATKLITPTQYKALSETEQANYERNRKNVFEIFKDGKIVGAGTQLYLHTFTKFHDEGPGWTEEFKIICTSDKQMTYTYIANTHEGDEYDGNGVEGANFGSINFYGHIIAAEYRRYSDYDDYFVQPYYCSGFTAITTYYSDWANPMWRTGIDTIGGKRVDSVLGTETMKSSVRPL